VATERSCVLTQTAPDETLLAAAEEGALYRAAWLTQDDIHGKASLTRRWWWLSRHALGCPEPVCGFPTLREVAVSPSRPRVAHAVEAEARRVTHDDADLVTLVMACREGDPLAQRALWDRYAPGVRRLLLRLLGAPEDVDDALQDTFCALFRDLRLLRTPSALPAFIRATAVNVVRKQRRTRRLQRLLGLLPGPAAFPETENRGANPRVQATVRRLYDMLQHFPEEECTIFLLRFIEGLDLEEIAKVTGISLATVKRRLASASSRLRRRGQRDPLLAEYLRPSSEKGSSS
jgi:RNA polymerase sigma-70 factor (ECF subfamily)